MLDFLTQSQLAARSYAVKEIYYTLQGEGFHTGRSAVFLRFAGCNLWSGREQDRATAVCDFCDTDFLGVDGPGGGKFTDPQQLAKTVSEAWSREAGTDSGRFVVVTGGEPLLQFDSAAIEAIRDVGFEIAIETNGTLPAPAGIDWICVSPKAGADLVQRTGNELKYVFPQPQDDPEKYAGLGFEHFYLQPMDGPNQQHNTHLAIDYCRTHPSWKLSVQTHKLLGLP